MLITVHGVDLEVRAGTPVSAIAEFAAQHADHSDVPAGVALEGQPLWCGPVLLAADHPAGTAPVLEGALIGTAPGPLTHPPPGLHAAVIAGPDAGHVFPLRGPVTVGRGGGCDVVIDDPALSRVHLRFSVEPGKRGLRGGAGLRGESGLAGELTLRVADAGSTNGTRLRSGARSHQVNRDNAVAAGSLIEAGRSVIQIRRGAAAGVLNLDTPAMGPIVPESCGSPRGAGALGVGVIAVVGEPRWSAGFARGLVLDRGRRPRAGQWSEPWMRWLGSPSGVDGVVVLAPGARVPDGCTAVAHAGPAGVEIEALAEVGADNSEPGRHLALPALCVSADAAEASARRLAAATAGDSLPAVVTWSDVATGENVARARDRGQPDAGAAAPAPDGVRGLAVALGTMMHSASIRGTFTLDLDAGGPHVLVAGSKGSGVSTVIDTLVYALACKYTPRELSLAVLDLRARPRTFARLPHMVGELVARDGEVDRDRDGQRALDALAALEREVAARRAGLAASGCSAFAEWERQGGAPPRLAILAIEFQAITPWCRDFVPRLTALAHEARELGVHAVMSTSSPAGAVTAQVRAVVGTTLALRVHTESESKDLVGTPHAARLPGHTPGRAIVAAGTTRAVIQVALPIATRTPAVQLAHAIKVPDSPTLAEVALARWVDAPRRPPLWN